VKRLPSSIRRAFGGLRTSPLNGGAYRCHILTWSVCRIRDPAAAGKIAQVDEAVDALCEAALRAGYSPFEIEITVTCAMRTRPWP
jgi:hypothetical protein